MCFQSSFFFLLDLILQKKRSLASHLSGYNPSKLNDISDQKPNNSPDEITEDRKEHDDQDHAMCSKTTNKETGGSDAALRDSGVSRLSKLQLKSMKFLVPVVHRSRI
jgi:hypothetical protein